MIEVIDRIPTYPGRVKLIPVPGQADTYDMVRADEPIVQGTPVNKALFDSMQNLITEAVHTIDNKVFEFSQFATVGSLAVGAPFGLYENGIMIPYIKLKDDYEGTGRPLVLRRNVTHLDAVYASKTLYGQTATDAWLNGEFLTRFDAMTQDAITEVPIEVIATGDTTEFINRRAFLLSLSEYQSPNGYMYRNGDPGTFFDSDAKRVALYNGVVVAQHSRTSSSSFEYFGIITEAGVDERVAASTVAGIRPAFTLPHTFNVVIATYTTANHVIATAEVI